MDLAHNLFTNCWQPEDYLVSTIIFKWYDEYRPVCTHKFQVHDLKSWNTCNAQTLAAFNSA